MADQLYHLPNVRDLLLNGFDERELRRLCYDVPDFRPVYDRLASKTGKAEIIDELLQYAESKLLIDTLLALCKERNPARYEHDGPYYYDSPTPVIQKQLSDLATRVAELTGPKSLSREEQYQLAFRWRELGGEDSLRGFDLFGVDLCLADLAGADLRVANLSRADLRMANLNAADLRAANLEAANLCDARLQDAKLEHARLGPWGTRDNRTPTLLRGVDLTNASLLRADMRSADLTGAVLVGADLRWCNLGGCLLVMANLTKANLYAATLDGANLTGASVARQQVASALTYRQLTGIEMY